MEDSRYSVRDLKMKILAFLGRYTSAVNRINMLGRGIGLGDLEREAKIAFTPAERALANVCLDQLGVAGLVMSNYNQMGPDADDWVTLTPRGKAALERGDLDELDRRLRALRPDLVDQRSAAWSALYSGEPEAARQAALSVRQLIWNTLEALSPKAGRTLKQQIKSAFALGNVPSQSTTDYIEAQANLVTKTLDLLTSQGKTGPRPSSAQVEDVLRCSEGMLRRLLGVAE